MLPEVSVACSTAPTRRTHVGSPTSPLSTKWLGHIRASTIDVSILEATSLHSILAALLSPAGNASNSTPHGALDIPSLAPSPTFRTVRVARLALDSLRVCRTSTYHAGSRRWRSSRILPGLATSPDGMAPVASVCGSCPLSGPPPPACATPRRGSRPSARMPPGSVASAAHIPECFAEASHHEPP